MNTDTKNDRVITIKLRDDFYRDSFGLLWTNILLNIGIIVTLMLLSMYFFVHQVLPVGFNVSKTFKVQEDTPLNTPALSMAQLTQWIVSAVSTVLSNDFINYDSNIKNYSKYFTATAYKKYLDAIADLLSHDIIVHNKSIIVAKADGSPVVLNQGVVGGVYSWWLQMPVVLSNVSLLQANSELQSNIVVQVLVSRTSTLDNIDGIKIDNFIIAKS